MSWLGILLMGLLLGVGYFLFRFRTIIQKMYFFSTAEWDNGPKDLLIIHCFPRGKNLPSPSPFVIKVETYCRMANIPYKIDDENPFGPKGKSPWISYNGTHVSDSQLVLEFLNKKFNKDLSVKLTKEQRALGRTIRIMVEEHLFWGLFHWRWIGGVQHISKEMNLPANLVPVLKIILGRRVRNMLWAQGLGRHTFEEMTAWLLEDLRNLSTLLGTKKYFLGDEPCEEDCAIFGMLACLLWGSYESPYENILANELPNLKEYCVRMKSKYWADWNELCTEMRN